MLKRDLGTLGVCPVRFSTSIFQKDESESTPPSSRHAMSCGQHLLLGSCIEREGQVPIYIYSPEAGTRDLLVDERIVVFIE